MKLKKIGLHGFKSFKDKINLEFDHPITAIVGPNGSGKSNIADGIRWVLGEQSAKSLRGTKMEDIIFAGTEKIKPVNVAQVSMTFDNESQWLPLDYKEITIERRVFRNGESNYYLNKSKCKLRDIKELFLDTGIGKDGYSIIGQGRIESILNSKSEDRREIFEEASGISKLKYKKIESLKKLEHVRENVKTIEELLNVKSAELNYLKKEASRASKAMGIEKDLLEKDKNIDLYDIQSFNRLKEEYSEKLNELETQMAFIKDEKDDLSQQLSSITEELADLNVELEKQEKELRDLEINKEKLKSNYDLNQEKLHFSKNESERLKTQIGIYTKNIERKKEDKQNLFQEAEKLKEKIKEYTRAFKKAQASIQEFKEQENILNHEYRLFIETLDGEKNEFNRLTALKETNFQHSLHEEKNTKEYLEQEEKTAEEIEKHKRNILIFNDKAVELSNRISRNKEKRQYLEEKLETERRKLQESEGKKINLEIEGKDLRNKYNFLFQIKDNYEGYYRQVASFLKELKKNESLSNKSRGALADLIQVEKKYEKAIEVLLSGNLQSIVTRTDQDAKDLVRFLKEKKIGRLTFLPMESIKAKKATEDIQDPDVLCIASTVVRSDDEYRSIIDYFLNRTLIVQNMDTAIKIKKKYPYYRIATLDADLINTWGSIVGGYKKTQNMGVSIVNREKEIEDIKNKIKEKSKQFEIEINFIKDHKESLEQYKKDLEDLDREVEELQKEMENIQNQKEYFSTQIEILGIKQEEYKKYYEKKSETIFTKDHEERLAYLEKSIQEKSILKEEMELKLESNQKSLQTFEMDHYKADNLSEAGKRDLRINENQLLKIEEETSQERILLAEDQNKLEDLYKTIQLLEEENRQINVDAEQMEVSYHKKQQENPILKQHHLELAQKREKINRRISEIDKDNIKKEYSIHSLTEKIERQEEKILKEVDRIFEEYNISLNLEDKYQLNESISVDHTRQEIKNMKKTLFQIGEYRKESIEEYEKESEEYNNMNNQKMDLIETTLNLEKIISSLDENMKTNFIESFKKINKNFNRIFQVLFNGGKASLRVDENDILSSGIEIVAEPPGKKLQNLNLLSGGERSLTAVALLFAIFENHPSPFCILDEIDAALDEANIYRYTKYLKELSEYTQFIMITHRKSTMEIADVLYGVSMQKEGISNVITLDLK